MHEVLSAYEVLSADGRIAWRRRSGPKWRAAQAKDRALLDNLQTALGKHQRSLGLGISTQAARNMYPLVRILTMVLIQIKAAL